MRRGPDNVAIDVSAIVCRNWRGMESILSATALDEYGWNGFFRPGIMLPAALTDRIKEVFRSPDAKGSNWSHFRTLAPRSAGPLGYRLTNRLASSEWRPRNRRIHRTIRRDTYVRNYFGTSELLLPVLNECMAQGLGKQFKENHLLVSHDYFLENSSNQGGFGPHEDGWNVETFYETDDDLALYVQLQDVTEATGGRLMVDPGFRKRTAFRDRNLVLKHVSDLCEDAGCLDDDGYADRETVKRCDAVLKPALQLTMARMSRPGPPLHDLTPIDAREGELILFNPKNFHCNEAWASRNTANRMIYAIRLMPIYDVRLRPPMSFLNRSPCNRYVLDTREGILLPMDNQPEQLRRYCIPSPRRDSRRRAIAAGR